MPPKKNVEAEFRSLLIDELKEISEKQEGIGDKLNELITDFKLHQQESNTRWETISKLDAEQNTLLAEHAAYSVALQRQNELLEKKLRAEIFGEGVPDAEARKGTVIGRVEALEEPRVWATKTVQIIIWLATTIAALGGAVAYISGLAKP